MLDHFESLYVIVIILVFNCFGSMLTFLGKHHSFIPFVFKFKSIAFFHFRKNMSQLFFKLTWFWIWMAICFINLLNRDLSMYLVFFIILFFKIFIFFIYFRFLSLLFFFTFILFTMFCFMLCLFMFLFLLLLFKLVF